MIKHDMDGFRVVFYPLKNIDDDSFFDEGI